MNSHRVEKEDSNSSSESIESLVLGDQYQNCDKEGPRALTQGEMSVVSLESQYDEKSADCAKSISSSPYLVENAIDNVKEIDSKDSQSNHDEDSVLTVASEVSENFALSTFIEFPLDYKNNVAWYHHCLLAVCIVLISALIAKTVVAQGNTAAEYRSEIEQREFDPTEGLLVAVSTATTIEMPDNNWCFSFEGMACDQQITPQEQFLRELRAITVESVMNQYGVTSDYAIGIESTEDEERTEYEIDYDNENGSDEAFTIQHSNASALLTIPQSEYLDLSLYCPIRTPHEAYCSSVDDSEDVEDNLLEDTSTAEELAIIEESEENYDLLVTEEEIVIDQIDELIDFASIEQGAVILMNNKKTSPCFIKQSNSNNFWRQPVKQVDKQCMQHAKILLSEDEPNENDYYSMQGDSGLITIGLLTPVEVYSIILQFVIPSYANNYSTLNAPNLVNIIGYDEHPTQRKQYTQFALGSFYFDIDNCNEANGCINGLYTQEYIISYEVIVLTENEVPKLKAISIEMLSNQGNKEFTHLHRVKVMGK